MSRHELATGCGCGSVLLVLLIVGGWFGFSQCSNWWSETTQAEEEACRQDVDCWGKKYQIYAESACVPAIERQALYKHEWTDGFGESKLPFYSWDDEGQGTIIYEGSAIRFQNGFGAWRRMAYACYYRPAKEKHEGAAYLVDVVPY